jgi:hypothetical protein
LVKDLDKLIFLNRTLHTYLITITAEFLFPDVVSIGAHTAVKVDLMDDEGDFFSSFFFHHYL